MSYAIAQFNVTINNTGSGKASLENLETGETVWAQIHSGPQKPFLNMMEFLQTNIMITPITKDGKPKAVWEMPAEMKGAKHQPKTKVSMPPIEFTWVTDPTTDMEMPVTTEAAKPTPGKVKSAKYWADLKKQYDKAKPANDTIKHWWKLVPIDDYTNKYVCGKHHGKWLKVIGTYVYCTNGQHKPKPGKAKKHSVECYTAIHGKHAAKAFGLPEQKYSKNEENSDHPGSHEWGDPKSLLCYDHQEKLGLCAWMEDPSLWHVWPSHKPKSKLATQKDIEDTIKLLGEANYINPKSLKEEWDKFNAVFE